METEPAGMLRVLSVITEACASLAGGTVLVCDDMDLHLHPRVTRWIAEQFASGRNPNSAQLVASLSDTSLMDLKHLVRRDQIYFTEKNGSGVSRLTCLSDFTGVRKDSDVQKAYFGWKFGSLPNINSSEQLLRR